MAKGLEEGIRVRLAAEFSAWTGTRPDGIWSAPGRVTLVGEYLDLCGGPVLPATIDLRVWVALRRRPGGRLRVRSLQRPEELEIDREQLRPRAIRGWAAYPLGAIWAVTQLHDPGAGLDVLLDGLVPEGAGLSSSAAVECAVVEAVTDSLGVRLSRRQKVAAARRAEAEFVGVPCGLMDQVTAVFGMPGSALRFDSSTGTVLPTPFDPAAAGDRLFVIDTGSRRRLADSPYPQRRLLLAAAGRMLGRERLVDASAEEVDRLPDPKTRGGARHALTERDRVERALDALGRTDHEELGRIMSESHRSLRDDLDVSAPELDLAVEAACSAGAYGAKLTGAGFSGAVVAIGPEDSQSAIDFGLRAAFADAGLKPPTLRVVEPAPGARRDR